MGLRRLFTPFLFFAFVIPLCGQVQLHSEVQSLLESASHALDRWHQLAPKVHCEDATQTQFRDACKLDVLTVGQRVQEAQTQIAHYRQLSAPELVDLFDAYESFRRVMEVVDNLNYAPDSYGEQNRRVFAEAYNTFVKVNGWFGGVVRISIQNTVNCSGRTHT